MKLNSYTHHTGARPRLRRKKLMLKGIGFNDDLT